MKTIDADQLKNMIDDREALTLIDTLPQESYQKEHIPGAQSVPAKSSDFVAQVERIVSSRAAPVIVYCANTECDLSPTAAKELEGAGFENVIDFEGGLQEWKDSGYELEGAGNKGGATR